MDLAEIRTELDRIELEVRAGASLSDLGFWRLVARIKADPRLVDELADHAGRIDRIAFEARVRPRFPVWLGNAALAGAVLAGGLLAWFAAVTSQSVPAGLALIAAAGAWAVGVHCPTHWLAGRVVGIGFVCFFFGGPPPPRPGLKTDYATYLRATPTQRAWMHASGAVATKLAPFVALALWPATNAPGWAAWVVLGLGVLQIATDLAFSVRTSDWKRVRRELAIARATYTRGATGSSGQPG